MRRSYYLDLGIISGFAATALGLMGFRSRQCYWLPNRNYISGIYYSLNGKKGFQNFIQRNKILILIQLFVLEF